jgi:uncharacterized lipoprotein YbaY
MSQYRTEEDVRNYDIFKGIVTALLLITLFIMAALGYGGADETASTSPGGEEVAVGDSQAEESMDSEASGAPESVEVISPPDLLSPAPGSALEAGPQTFSGMGTPGNQVALVAGSTELGRSLVDPNGTWEMEAQIPPGVEAIQLQELDNAGNLVASSDPIPMTSASAAAEGQAVETAESGEAEPSISPTVTLPSEELIAGRPFTLDGTGQPGAILRLLDNGSELGDVTVADDGTWSLAVDLSEGDHEIDVALLDAEGGIEEIVPAISIPVAAPEGPSFVLPELPIPDFNPLTGAFAWYGESAPGSRVAAIVDDQIADEATADSEGRWQIVLPLAAGVHALAFGQMDENGNVTSSSEPVTVEVPGRVPQLDLPDEGTAADTPSPEVNIPAGTTELTGTADPGQEVALIVNGEVTATAVADGDGNFTLPADISDVTRSLQLGIVGDDGTLVAKSIEVTVSTGETVAEAPAEGESEEPAAAATEVPGAVATEEPAADATEVAAEGGAEAASAVSGTVTYQEDITLPGGTVVTVQVINLSVADTAAEVVGETTIEAGDSQVPIPYEVSYDAAEVNENLLYGVTARIESSDGTLLFISDTNQLVITNGNPTEDVEVNTVQVPSAAADAELGVVEADLNQSAASVLEAMEDSGQFTILLDGLEAAGLTDRLAQTDSAYTVFAPTDEAFEALPPGIMAGWNFTPDEFATILRNTVVEGLYTPDDLTNGLVLRSIGESNIGIQHAGDLIVVNSVPVIDAAAAGESYVYALPQVIIPPLPAGVTAPAIDSAGVPIFVGDWLTAVGVGQPGMRIVLTIDGEQFGDVATINDERFWQVEGPIGPGIHSILAYMIGNDGLLMAISPEVTLAVAEE